MSKIVGVHGIAQQYRGPSQLQVEWYSAMHDGLVLETPHLPPGSLDKEDLSIAFFGDLFRPSGALAFSDPPFSASDLVSASEIDLVSCFYDQAVQLEPELGPTTLPLGKANITVQFMIERLLRSRALAGWIPERAFVSSLKQVTKFLSDGDVKRSVLERLDLIVNDDTKILVGHSLGSVIAYEYLCSRRPANIVLFVTLGSPLGIRNVVFDRLRPAPVAGVGAWPGEGPVGEGGVAKWTNITDENDFVALRKDLRGLFHSEVPGREVRDLSVCNGYRAHSVTRYLCSRTTGAEIAQVLLDGGRREV